MENKGTCSLYYWERKRGRPRRQWEKGKDDVLKMPVSETGRLASYRDEFPTSVRGPTSSPGKRIRRRRTIEIDYGGRQLPIK